MGKGVGTMCASGPSRDINCYKACEGLALKSDIIPKKHVYLSVNISVQVNVEGSFVKTRNESSSYSCKLSIIS